MLGSFIGFTIPKVMAEISFEYNIMRGYNNTAPLRHVAVSRDRHPHTTIHSHKLLLSELAWEWCVALLCTF